MWPALASQLEAEAASKLSSKHSPSRTSCESAYRQPQYLAGGTTFSLLFLVFCRIRHDDDGVVLCDEATPSWDFCLADNRSDQPSRLSPIAGSLKNYRIRANYCGT